MTHLLSKSSYKLALECPRKLVYRRERYPSSADEDPYLEFLADGGFLVEAVARALFPDGQIIVPHEGETPAQATARLLESENVDLFEAGIIDATRVLRVALENAVSVASLLLLTEATMTELPEKQATGPAVEPQQL